MRIKTTKRQSHSKFKFRLKPAYAAVLLAFSVHPVHANPLDPTVVSGQASFATSGNTLTVTNTPGAIINWQGFSIGANEITRFAQQSASSAVLNRVISNNPSSILGTLQSNGRVFLINPNGIVFGAGSVVDVAGLVASTLNLSDADFLAGRNSFTQVPGAASISNAGDISAQDGGQIFLIAPDVENTGVITAPNGEILLVAGHSVDLVSTSDPNLRVNITAPAGDATNVGQLIASSGSLGLFGTVVRNSGTVSADSATMQGGKIVFRSTQRTEAGGTVSAQGVGGGEIKILSDMQTGTVNVTGTLDASAPVSGDGGYIDTSAAHVQVADGAHVSTVAANGNNGTWLIDPTDFYVSAVDPGGGVSYMSNTMLSTNLGFGNVTIQTLATGAGNGDIFVNDAVSWSSNTTLTLNAIRNIEVNAAISKAGTGNLIVRADLNGSSIGTIIFGASGSVALTGGGRADLYYNPVSYTDATTKSDVLTNPYSTKITGTYTAWMLVNDVGLETGGTLGLQAMNTNLAGNYALGGNIDASGTKLWNAGVGFVPVGDFTTNFTGQFDGLGHTIGNLSMNNLGDAGLFGVIGAGGAVNNAGLVGSSLKGKTAVGGLAGTNYGSVFNSYVSGGSVTGVNNVGGLVGVNAGGDGGAGGAGTTGVPGSPGVVGVNAVVSNSYVSGVTVNGVSNVGGLVGQNIGGTGGAGGSGASPTGAGGAGGNGGVALVVYSYVSGGTVTGTGSYVGGLVGNNALGVGGSPGGGGYGGIGGGPGGAFISNSYTGSGTVTGGSIVGGVLGYNFYGIVINTFRDVAGGAANGIGWDFALAAPSDSGTTALTTAQMMDPLSAISGLDLAGMWWMSGGNTRPFLRSEWNTNITNAHQLQLMAMGLGASYTLGANIDASETALGTGMWGSAGFAPLGTNPNWPIYGIAFTGQLDGQGRTISNLKINRPSESYVGLFGGLGWGAIVNNVGLVGGSVSGLSTVGALAAYNYGSISNSYVSGMNISGCGSCSNIGGLVGVNDYNITSSYVSGGSISGGWYVGGLVGHNWSATIDSSYVIGGVGSSISGSGAVGGLVGWNGGNIINGSYVSAGNVSGGSSVGGLVGKNTDFGSISNSYVDTGTVVTGNVSVGGMLGWDSGEGVITGNTVTDTTVNGNSFVGGLIGKYSVSAWSSVAGYTDNNHVINSFVSGGTVVGGLMGANGGSLTNSYVTASTVIGTSTVGGLVGTNSGSISNSYYNINSVLINGPNQVTRYGLYNNVLNINGVGQFDDWFNGGLLTPLNIANYSASLVSAGVDSYTIGDVYGMKDLLGFADNGAYTFSLTANINLVTVPGYYVPYLAANFDGVNFTISNMSVSLPNDNQGLFGHIAPGNSVINVKLLNAVVAGGSNIGALAGWNEGSIVNSNSTGGTVNGSSFVGGLIGNNMGAVSTSYVSGSTVSGTNAVGGLVGQNIGGAFTGTASSAATIISSYVSGGTVSGISNVGGLVGQNIGGNGGGGGPVYSVGLVGTVGGAGGAATISNSFVSGTTIGGDSNVGGLVGQMLSGNGGNGGFAYYGTGGTGGAGGAATVDNSYVTGATVTGVASNIGGLVGSNVSGVAGGIGAGYIGGVGGAGGAAGAATIGNSYVSGGTVTSTYTSGSSGVFLGGLAGYNGGIISNSYVSGGSVVASLTDGTGAVGGLAGYNTGTISNTYVSGGTVNGNGVWEIGGLVGVNAVGGNISYSYAATGMTSGWGQHKGLVSNNDGVVSNSIWDADLVLSGIGLGSGTATVTGLTTAQMTTMSNFTNAGWNIADTGGAGKIWRIYEGSTTPLLTSFLTPLTVTANDATKTYDANPFSGGNGVTASIVGAVVSGTPVYGGTSQGAVNTGSYVITASGLYSDQLGYDISYVNGALTITPAAATLLSVTAQDASKTYGATLTFSGTEFTPVGLLGSDTISSVTLTSAGAVNTANAGTYAITPSNATFSLGSASNYTLTYVDGVLTVTPVSVTIAANAATKVYGDADAITFTASGLMTWDTNASAFTGALSHIGALTPAGENAGTYPSAIIQGTLASTNYTITGFTTNDLIITQAPLTVTANATSKILNTADPLLTYMVSGLKFTDTEASTLSGELSRVAGETVGIYPINQGTLALISTNYTMTFVPGRFTILVPTVVNEIVNTSLMFSPDTGSAESTSSSDEEDKAAEEVLADADINPVDGTTAQPLPVCPQ